MLAQPRQACTAAFGAPEDCQRRRRVTAVLLSGGRSACGAPAERLGSVRRNERVLLRRTPQAHRARASRPPTASANRPAGVLQWLRANREQASKLGETLQTHGLAGVLAYGLLNTAYYSSAFLLVWVHVLRVPAGLGAAAAARRFAETFVLVWAGSQVTKLARFGGALLLAPAASKLLDAVQARLPQHLQSRGAAFALSVCACVLAAGLLFGSVVLLWA